jgi:hypothetical protein
MDLDHEHQHRIHRDATRKGLLGAALFAPIPGLAFLGLGYGRPVLWLNKIRKADEPVEFATASAWRKYKTARAVLTVTGSVSVVGYYRDQYVQDAAWKLIQGEKPEDVRDWMQDEHNIPHQEAVAIILQLNAERQEFLKSGLGGYTSRTGTEARSFYDMDGLSLLKTISTPTPKAGMSWKKSSGSIFREGGMTKGDPGFRRGARTRTRPWWFSTKAKRRISRKRS